MPWETDTKKRWDDGKILVLEKAPFFGAIALSMTEVIEERDLPWQQMTLATDGDKLYVNPEFLKSKARLQMVVLRLHEIGHVAMKHPIHMHGKWKHWCQDMGTRMLLGMAQDHVVNNWIKESTPWIDKAIFDSFEGEWVCEDRFKNMTVEEVMRILLAENPPPPPCPVHGPGGTGQQSQQQGGQGQGAPQNAPGSPQSGPGQPGGTQSPQKTIGRKGAKQGASGKGQAQPSCTCQHGPGCCRGGTGETGMSDDQIRELERKIDDAIINASKIAKARGLTPGGMDRLVEEILYPVEDPLEKLSRLLQGKLPNDYSWKRPNRRYIGRGMYLPSLEGKGVGKMAFAVDTSGSMYPEELSLAWGVVKEAVEDKQPEKFYLVFADSEVATVREVETDDEVDEFLPKGGGGTDFAPVFKWAEGEELDVLVYFTDMEAPGADLQDPGIPVIWVCCRPLEETNPAWKPPFGDFVHVSKR